MKTWHSETSNMRPVAVRLQQVGRRAPSWRPPEPGWDPASGVNRPGGFEAQTRDTVVFTVVRAMSAKPQIPPEIEEYRDERWRREGTRQVETALDAERFIEQVGFAACLTDSRRPGPSLYVAVCGRRDAVLPRNVQKDVETSLTWVLKDEIVRRGKVYYAKFARGKAMFLAPRMIPYFHAVWGMRRSEEKRRLSRNARAILNVLRKEWEMSTADLRGESGVRERKAFTRGLDELQAAMIVVPSEVL